MRAAPRKTRAWLGRSWANSKGFRFAWVQGDTALLVTQFFLSAPRKLFMSASETSITASRVNMVSLQRWPMLPTRHSMEVDGARFFSRRAVRTFIVCSLCGFHSPTPSLRAFFIHGCHVNWSHVRVRRTISSCDLGGRLNKRERARRTGAN